MSAAPGILSTLHEGGLGAIGIGALLKDLFSLLLWKLLGTTETTVISLQLDITAKLLIGATGRTSLCEIFHKGSFKDIYIENLEAKYLEFYKYRLIFINIGIKLSQPILYLHVIIER